VIAPAPTRLSSRAAAGPAPLWRLRVYEELPSTQDVVLRAAEAMEYCLKHPFEKAMAKFNGA